MGPPLKEYLEVVQAVDGRILVDDAHAMAVLGDTGRGSPQAQGVGSECLYQTGTLSKGFGAAGGLIPADGPLLHRIRERSPAFIGCTGLALPLAAASIESMAHLAANTHLIRDLQNALRGGDGAA
mgnify:CR=1 FL=1